MTHEQAVGILLTLYESGIGGRFLQVLQSHFPNIPQLHNLFPHPNTSIIRRLEPRQTYATEARKKIGRMFIELGDALVDCEVKPSQGVK